MNVTPEAKGWVRTVFNDIRTQEKAYLDAIERDIMPRLRARMRIKRSLRPEHVIEVMRAFQTLRHPYRLTLDTTSPRKGHVLVINTLLGAASEYFRHWRTDQWEHTVSIDRIIIGTTEGRLRIKTESIADVSLHALARFYERARRRTVPDLLASLKVVSQADLEETETQCEQGVWIGGLTYVTEDKQPISYIRSIRTFIGADQREDHHQSTGSTTVRLPV